MPTNRAVDKGLRLFGGQADEALLGERDEAGNHPGMEPLLGVHDRQMADEPGESGICTSCSSRISFMTAILEIIAHPKPVATSPLRASGLPSSITTLSNSGGMPALSK